MSKKQNASHGKSAGSRPTAARPDVAAGAGVAIRWGVLDVVALPPLLVLVVAVARMPILTPDVWWHLATGRLIAASGIPRQDPFSYTLGERAWTVHEWLADRLLFGAFENGDLLGVVLMRAVLVAAAVAAAYAVARLRGSALLGIVLLAAAAWATQRNWLDRPQLWSFLLGPVLLWILEAHRLGRHRVAFALPAVFALWVNLHGGFMFGLGIVAVWVLGEMLRARTNPAARAGLRSLWIGAGLGALCTLLNPNVFEGATYPLTYVGSGLSESLQEERPGDLDSGYAWVHFALLVALLGSLLVRLRDTPPQHVVLGVFLAWISMPRLGGGALPFAAERHAPLLLLLGTPLLVWQWSRAVPSLMRFEASIVRRVGGRLGAALAAVVTVASLAVALPALPRDSNPADRILAGRYPDAAVRWLQQNRLPGNMINPYRWGGHLAFHLYPDYQVWIDSRGDLYGIERIREFEVLYRMPPGAERVVPALLDRYDANVIVWHLLTIDFGPLQVHPFAEWLLRSPDWRLVFFDREPIRSDHPAATTGVFLREHPRNAALLEKHPPARTPRLPRVPRRAPTPRQPPPQTDPNTK